MIAAETLRLLRWHAGLDGDPLDPASISGSTAAQAPVDAAVAAFIQVLQRLNVELNGPAPSEATRQGDQSVPISAAYAVAEVARMLRNAKRDDAAWEIDTAWLAVLAGDIDDVPEHAAFERHTRG